MSRSLRRLGWVLIAAPPLLACGGSPTSVPVAVATPAKKCRQYATGISSITQVNGGEPIAVTSSCSFDAAALALRCTNTGSPDACPQVVTTYPSVADFIEEAQAVGRDRKTTVDASCSTGGPDIYTYDAQKRLTRRHSERSDTAFSAWDALGRPTQSSSIYGPCGTKTIEYDDTARTMTTRTVADCADPFTLTQWYDGAGNALNYVLTQSDFSMTETATVTATAEVCL